ncbi:MAG: FAD:protein FMN transferase [Candidatus Faecousia sp.]|nr:FAD:protein FMN transferase [Clostridiales bacterium]MDD6297101.1 FAD:protein FMN transferase [Bacillota bacterium]MDD7341603.1 FAD:protein FMN transferase [Bacillota bacterium]MDY2810491.1 FAD:protein FMN transferase [Candidatus Faecousia sp.]
MKKLKRLFCLCLVTGLLIFLVGCPATAPKAEPKGMAYFTYFDTVSYIYSYASDSQEAFEANCALASDILEKYHQLFDIYHEYSGVVNLATINANAGGEALEVAPELIAFLLDAKEMYALTGGEMNVMMGSVLKLWHDCRENASKTPENAAIPTQEALTLAAGHTDIDALEIDEAKNTVRITDPEASLDVGALAKGYATEQAAQALKDAGVDGYVLNIGGNIRTIGTKADGNGWTTGIKDPQNTDQFAARVMLQDTSCVTSGNYERYFTVNGVRYHHIIDPTTNMPAGHFSSVTVITADSALADALSTALFCMTYEDGLALTEKLDNVEVLWITTDGTQYKTPGLELL